MEVCVRCIGGICSKSVLVCSMLAMTSCVRRGGFPTLPESQAGVSSANRSSVSFQAFRVRRLAPGHNSSLLN